LLVIHSGHKTILLVLLIVGYCINNRNTLQISKFPQFFVPYQLTGFTEDEDDDGNRDDDEVVVKIRTV